LEAAKSPFFQSYLSPILTGMKNTYKIVFLFFQSYLSPILTMGNRVFRNTTFTFQSYLSPILTITDLKGYPKFDEEYKSTFNPTLVRF